MTEGEGGNEEIMFALNIRFLPSVEMTEEGPK